MSAVTDRPPGPGLAPGPALQAA
ncbi:MAG: hypothetical protein JWL68_6250, partial [Actinomycetia bacterium]|nr:hypothetical protein [Actinomycetes bacterium]